jgi:exopolysaccharide biosynthesis polyprenyl glycosylphosphotransferase
VLLVVRGETKGSTDVDGSAAAMLAETAGTSETLDIETGGVPVTRRRFGSTRTLPPAVRQAPEQDLFTPDGALLEDTDVATTPRDTWRRRALALADVLALVVAYGGMWLIEPPTGALIERAPLLGMLPAWVVINKLLGLYDRDDKVMHRSTLDELPKILHSITLGALIVFLIAPLVLPLPVHQAQTALFCLLCSVTMPLARVAVRATVRTVFPPERCVILGSGAVAQVMARKIASHPEYGVELVGYLDDERVAGRRSRLAIPYLGDVRHVDRICRAAGIERVVIAFAALGNDEMLEIVRVAKRARLKVTIVPRLYEVIGHSVELDEVEGMTVLSLRGLSRSRSTLMIKRLIDIAGAVAGLIALAPLMAVLAIAIKLDSKGPVLYRQPRMGRASSFMMLKFRSMVTGADALKGDLKHLNEAHGPMFKIAEDPRITRVGRFIRRTSLDELPQLWNVLRGEMSLVGPRPLVPDEDSHVIGWHRERLDLTPGLTGPWQVSGRTAIPFEEMVKMDYLYVAEWSLWNDIRLLLRTAPVVLLGRGQ